MIVSDLRRAQKAAHRTADLAVDQAVLCRFTDSLYCTDAAADVYEAALDAITTALRCARASISLSDTQGVMRVVARRGPSEAGADSVADHSPWSPADRDPRPVWISDLAHGSDELRTAVGSKKARGLAFIPLVAGGVLVGQIMAHHRTAHEFTTDEIKLAVAIARQLGFWIERRTAEDRRLAAEEKLRESEERLRSTFEHASVGMVLMNGDCRIVSANAAFCRITGRARAALIGETCLGFTHPDDIPANLRAVLELERSPGPIAFEKRYARPEGGDIWVRMALTKAAHGQILAVVEDVDVRRRAQEALRESEERFRTIVDMTPECVKLVGADGTLLYVNAAGFAMLGAASGDEAVVGACLYDFAAPKDRERLRDFNERICAGERRSLDFEVIGFDGQVRRMESRAAPFRNSDGAVVQLAVTRDVTQRVRAEAQRTLLINELNHRVRNTLATVQSLALQTLRSTERSADANALLESRLSALARAHDVLNRASWESADLREVVDGALEPFLVGDRRISIEGPGLNLAPNQVLAVSIVLHELATNAAKYGALSGGSGRVGISWSSPGDDHEVKLVWEETGGPPVSPPLRRGFGSRLIERILKWELGAPASIEFQPSGVVATIGIASRRDGFPATPGGQAQALRA